MYRLLPYAVRQGQHKKDISVKEATWAMKSLN